MIEFICLMIKLLGTIRCVYSGYVSMHTTICIGEYIMNELTPEEYANDLDCWDNMRISYISYVFKIWKWKKIDIFKKEYKQLIKKYL